MATLEIVVVPARQLVVSRSRIVGETRRREDAERNARSGYSYERRLFGVMIGTHLSRIGLSAVDDDTGRGEAD